MLTFTSRQPAGKNCDGMSRRNFLKLGGLCVCGLLGIVTVAIVFGINLRMMNQGIFP